MGDFQQIGGIAKCPLTIAELPSSHCDGIGDCKQRETFSPRGIGFGKRGSENWSQDLSQRKPYVFKQDYSSAKMAHVPQERLADHLITKRNDTRITLEI